MMPSAIKIKICGMRDEENIRQVEALNPDYMGFIFYPGSARYAGTIKESTVKNIRKSIVKTAVFVNEKPGAIRKILTDYQFESVQLHGAESPGFCEQIKSENPSVVVIKTFLIASKDDLEACYDYQHSCDYFLFDTRTISYGGSGRKFDWNILMHYKSSKQFFLSGGIGLADLSKIVQLRNSGLPLYAADLNSRFEVSAGIKNVDAVQFAINEIRNSSQLKNIG